MSQIKRRNIIIAAAIIIIVCGLWVVIRLFNVPIEHEIDITMRGIQTRNGEAKYVEEKSISIRGVHRQYRLGSRNDSFEGRIEVEGYDFTFEESLTVMLDFSDNRWLTEYPIKSFPLVYLGYRMGQFGIIGVSEHMGRIFIAPNYSEIFITVNDRRGHNSWGWSSYNGRFISFPADNREQAVDIANRLASRTEWE